MTLPNRPAAQVRAVRAGAFEEDPLIGELAATARLSVAMARS
jgi:hypothetical protein